MEKRYELTQTELGENLIMFDENGNASGVPFDLGNIDYQAYLAWLENPNEVEHLTEIPTSDEA